MPFRNLARRNHKFSHPSSTSTPSSDTNRRVVEVDFLDSRNPPMTTSRRVEWIDFPKVDLGSHRRVQEVDLDPNSTTCFANSSVHYRRTNNSSHRRVLMSYKRKLHSNNFRIVNSRRKIVNSRKTEKDHEWSRSQPYNHSSNNQSFDEQETFHDLSTDQRYNCSNFEKEISQSQENFHDFASTGQACNYNSNDEAFEKQKSFHYSSSRSQSSNYGLNSEVYEQQVSFHDSSMNQNQPYYEFNNFNSEAFEKRGNFLHFSRNQPSNHGNLNSEVCEQQVSFHDSSMNQNQLYYEFNNLKSEAFVKRENFHHSPESQSSYYNNLSSEAFEKQETSHDSSIDHPYYKFNNLNTDAFVKRENFHHSSESQSSNYGNFNSEAFEKRENFHYSSIGHGQSYYNFNDSINTAAPEKQENFHDSTMGQPCKYYCNSNEESEKQKSSHNSVTQPYNFNNKVSKQKLSYSMGRTYKNKSRNRKGRNPSVKKYLHQRLSILAIKNKKWQENRKEKNSTATADSSLCLGEDLNFRINVNLNENESFRNVESCDNNPMYPESSTGVSNWTVQSQCENVPNFSPEYSYSKIEKTLKDKCVEQHNFNFAVNCDEDGKSCEKEILDVVSNILDNCIRTVELEKLLSSPGKLTV